MRLLFSLFFSILLYYAASAQEASGKPAIDARLFEVYDSTYLETVLQSNPTLIRRWNFYLDHACMVTDFPAEKGDLQALPLVIIPDPTHFNSLKLEKEQRLSHHWNTSTLYRIEGTQKGLMYYSGQEYNRRCSANLK